MAEFRAMRLICKHFNFIGDYLDEELEYGIFWCYLAEALDAEELIDYRETLLAGGKEAKKKWKWATPDHAGTRAVVTRKEDVRASLSDFATMMGMRMQKTGNIDEYARIRGAQEVYRDGAGKLYDRNMNPIESETGLVFVASEKVH